MANLETTIKQVTVYQDRAQVTRRGVLQANTGIQVLTVGPLPRTLLNDSVRAAGRGNARLLGVEVVTTYSPAAPEGQAKALQDELERLQDQDRVLADEQVSWQNRLGLLKQISDQGGTDVARSLARGRLTLEQTTELLDYLSNSTEAGQSVLRDLAIKRRELARQIEAAKQRANQLQSSAQREWREARVSVDVQQEGQIEIELTYSTLGASWTSLYDARLLDHQIEMTYLAQVKQSTGEDWPEAELVLSTARPALSMVEPELTPWRINAFQPQPPPMMRMAPAPSAAPGAASGGGPAYEAMAMAAAPAPKMMDESAQVVSEGPSVSYRIQTPRAIPSDNAPHQVTVTVLRWDAALDYLIVPKLAEAAYLRAKFRNDTQFVLLGGGARLFHGSDFVGQRYLGAIAPREEVELFLGADDRIKVERQETERNVDKNILGYTAREQMAYRITVQNLLAENARVVVLDQIPVPQNPDIKVKLRETNPKPSAQDEQGELRWEFDLKPQQKQEITFGFVVEHPKEMRVVGL